MLALTVVASATAKPPGYWNRCANDEPASKQLLAHGATCDAARKLYDRMIGSGRENFKGWHCEFKTIGFDTGQALCTRTSNGEKQQVRIRVAAA